MKKKNTKAMLTRILACVLLVATLGLSLASCTIGDKAKNTAGKVWDTVKDGAEKIFDAAKDKITMEQTDDLGQISLLSLYTGIETVDEQDVMIQVIKAIVLPESATDKSTTWEVYWIDNQTGNEDAAVTDYVTVLACTEDEPYTAQSGSNYCKVTCKQPFAGSTIGVRVTTVVGGFTAECQVRYEGKPQFLNFHLLNEDGSDTYIAGKETFATGAVYKVKMVLGNAFWDVADNYGTYEVSLKLVGTIKADCIQYNTSGSSHYLTDEAYDISAYASKFASVAVEGNVLTVTVKQAIESFYGDYKGGATSGQYWQFAGYNDTGKPVMEVTVKDTVSGIENTLRFEIRSSVESVALSDNTLVF